MKDKCPLCGKWITDWMKRDRRIGKLNGHDVHKRCLKIKEELSDFPVDVRWMVGRYEE